MSSVKKDQVITASFSRNTLLLLLFLLATFSSARPIVSEINPTETSISKRGIFAATAKEAVASTQTFKDSGEALSETKNAQGAHSGLPSKANLGQSTKNEKLEDVKELNLKQAPETKPSTPNGKDIFDASAPLDSKPAKLKQIPAGGVKSEGGKGNSEPFRGDQSRNEEAQVEPANVQKVKADQAKSEQLENIRPPPPSPISHLQDVNDAEGKSHFQRLWKESVDIPTPYKSGVLPERNPSELGGDGTPTF
ncbi:hypothetical protein PTTG_12457 [Puccinia triticina 1-1 BBBD Race 1]|uniref:RxLR effector protein n=2 Tax=Puccinia triticina TaxID=208348 RepID=A0A180GIB9_PUCT1|nr:uncharacterized protein PtA15_15A78 [Puccinia triticina]OAV91713.1 hypothetical protein PTTG_12457 [Puccinia triticina 1-1 BBBD Race 1]WAQ91687.1 hypothetical protein PtA15_15A78 [Puccinia triticina]WAR62488.1 hypothetical protein PtB15_15B73 [Puccinia triticina]